MAVALECLNLILPVRAVAAVWPGGFAGFWLACGNQQRLQHDGRLLRVCAMEAAELEQAARFWQQRGLRRQAIAGAPAQMCRVDVAAGWIDPPCPWLQVDGARRLARLQRGPAVAPLLG
jgi:hypothetical protein